MKNQNTRVLVLGVTGRVIGSTAVSLYKLCPNLQIVVGSRNREKSATMVSTLRKNSAFAEVNVDNEGSLLMALILCLLSEVGVRSVDSSHSNVYFNILRCGSCGSCSRAFSTGTEMHCIGICHGNQGEERQHTLMFVTIPATLSPQSPSRLKQ